MPRVGSSTISSVGLRASHFASTAFCWLPPESVQTGFVSRPYFSCSRSAQSVAKRRSAPRGMSPARRTLSSDASAMLRSIEKSITSPCWRRSSGTSADAGRHRRRRRARRQATGRRSRPSPASQRSIPKIARATSRPPGADEAREGDDLAAPNLERDVGEDALARQPVDLQDDARPARSGTFGKSASMSRPTIARMIDCDRELLDRLRQDVAAVAHDGDALADREDLLEPVRDEEHRAPARAQRLDDAEQPLDLGRSSARRSARP